MVHPVAPDSGMTEQAYALPYFLVFHAKHVREVDAVELPRSVFRQSRQNERGGGDIAYPSFYYLFRLKVPDQDKKLDPLVEVHGTSAKFCGPKLAM